MATDIQTYLVDDILTKVDRASMACSLEARVPLLDHRVVEFAASLPLEFKYRRGVKKHLLRRVLHTMVPPRLVERPNMRCGIPLNRWLRGELKPLLNEYLVPGRVGREGFFRPDGVHRVVKEHLAGKRDHQHRIWALLMFALWAERYRPV